MKACIACKHLRVEIGFGGSDVTPATNNYFTCLKGRFGYSGPEDFVEDALSHGLDCPDFELSELARSKGWKVGERDG